MKANSYCSFIIISNTRVKIFTSVQTGKKNFANFLHSLQLKVIVEKLSGNSAKRQWPQINFHINSFSVSKKKKPTRWKDGNMKERMSSE